MWVQLHEGALQMKKRNGHFIGKADYFSCYLFYNDALQVYWFLLI